MTIDQTSSMNMGQRATYREATATLVSQSSKGRAILTDSESGTQVSIRATCDLPAGSVVMVCQPAALAPSNGPMMLRCGHCLARTAPDGGSLLRCTSCASVLYCSSKCQHANWIAGHAALCLPLRMAGGLQNLATLPGQLMLVSILHFLRNTESTKSKNEDISEPSSMTGNGADVLVLKEGGPEPITSDVDDTPPVSTSDVELRNALLLLRSNEDIKDPKIAISSEKMKAATICADKVSRMRFLRDHTEYINLQWFRTLLLMFSCNNFTVTDAENYPICEGTYPTGSLMNHSCVPNCQTIFATSTMLIKTLRDVRKGEELTISYIDGISQTPQRKQHLRSQYHFDCNCPACEGYTNSSGNQDLAAIIRIKDRSISDVSKELLAKFDEANTSAMNSNLMDNLIKPLHKILLDKDSYRKNDGDNIVDGSRKFTNVDDFIVQTLESIWVNTAYEKDAVSKSFSLIFPTTKGEGKLKVDILKSDFMDNLRTSFSRSLSSLESNNDDYSWLMLAYDRIPDLTKAFDDNLISQNWIAAVRLGLHVLCIYTIYYDSPYHPMSVLCCAKTAKAIWNSTEGLSKSDELLAMDVAEYFILDAIKRYAVNFVYDMDLDIVDLSNMNYDYLTRNGIDPKEMSELVETIVDLKTIWDTLSSYRKNVQASQ